MLLIRKFQRKASIPSTYLSPFKVFFDTFPSQRALNVFVCVSVHLDIGDHRIEVIGLENCLHMGQVRTGLKASARRLGTLLIRSREIVFIFFSTFLSTAQCSEIILTTKKTFPMQIDGEPWMQAPSIVSYWNC